jgi:hypothetical protein
MKGYVTVEAILFETAANKNVSNEECVFLGLVFPIASEFGGNFDLNNSNR